MAELGRAAWVAGPPGILEDGGAGRGSDGSMSEAGEGGRLLEVKALAERARILAEHVDHLLCALDDAAYAGDLDAALDHLQALFGQSPDLVIRRLPTSGRPRVLVAYLEGLVDAHLVTREVLRPLGRPGRRTLPPALMALGDTRWRGLADRLLLGHTLVFVAGRPAVFFAATQKPPKRSIERPDTEATIRGPQESFTEALSEQIGQLRRQLPDPALRIEIVRTGAQRMALAYVTGVANTDVVGEVRRRLQEIEVPMAVSATMVGSLIRDHPLSIFPTVRYTEHVGFVKWHLLQGRVAVLVDGDPFALVVPAVFLDFYTTPMDYNTGWYDASFARFIRLVGLGVSLTLPALYIVFTSVNPQLIPYQFLITMQGSHTGLPFTPFTEAVAMIFIIEVIREATLRLPKPLAGALGTMGAIVVGTAIVRAGLVSNQIIVIMTLTALSFFAVPAYEIVGAGRIVNLAFMVAGEVLGLFGVVLVGVLVTAALLSMQSFGVPYLSPVAPAVVSDWRDTLVRLPYVWLASRPRRLHALVGTWIRAIPRRRVLRLEGH
jgi:hypothetical protein